MKRLVVFYSLSGNTQEVAHKLAEKLDAELLKLETVKPMPKSFAAQILVGGGQVLLHHLPELKPLGTDLDGYDEIILGSPIWNSKGVPAINAFLQDETAAAKVSSLFFLSAGGDIQKGLHAITKQLPNLKRSISLLDRKHKDSRDNDEKLEAFAAAVLKQA